MPSIIYRLDDDPVLFSIYSLPPVRYPDGKTYYKIGGQLLAPEHLYGREELIEWFHGEGGRAEVEALDRVLRELIPGLQAQSYHSRPCVVTHTAHDRPYIDGWTGSSPAAAQPPVACSWRRRLRRRSEVLRRDWAAWRRNSRMPAPGTTTCRQNGSGRSG